MIIDTSAVVAVLLREPEIDEFASAFVDAPVKLMSAATRVELSLVIEGRYRDQGRADLERLMSELAIEIADLTLQHAEIAIDAFRRYGRGRHRAALNIGDCFSYALAKATELPLLFKGDDFVHTDIRPALMP